MATINVCDICDARDRVTRRGYLIGRVSDAAGGSEDEEEIFDLCEPCELLVLRNVIKDGHTTMAAKIDSNNVIIKKIKEKMLKY